MTNTDNKRFYGWIVAVGASLRLLAHTGSLYYSFPVFLPTLCEEFSWTRAAVSGAISLRGVLMGLLGPIAGIAIVKYGARKVLVYAAIVGSIGMAALYTLNELWQAYLFYGVVVGVSVGFSGLLGPMTVVNNWFIRRRGLAMAIVTIGGGLGGLTFPPLIAWLMKSLGWRPTFLVLAAITLVLGAVISGLIIRNRPEDMGQVSDGAATDAAEETEVKRASSLKVYQTPVDWGVKQAMRQPTTWIIIFSAMLSGFATLTVQVHQVAYLEDIGFSTIIAASALGLIPGASIIGSLVIGSLATRIEVRYLAILCATIRVFAVAILLNTTTLPLIYLYSALLGLAFGGSLIINPLFIGAYYGRTHYAQISGWMTPFSLATTALGPIIAGALYDATGTYNTAFIIMLVLCAAGGLGYFFAHPPKPPAELLQSME